MRCPQGAGGDFRLQTQFVAGGHPGLRQRLVVEQLLAGAAMVQFVAHQLAVRTVERQAHPLDEHDENAVDRHIVRRFDFR